MTRSRCNCASAARTARRARRSCAISALAGYALAENKALATLPATAYVIGGLMGSFPASMWMKRVGRRAGFLTGGAFGLAGSVLATATMLACVLVALSGERVAHFW